MTKDEALKLALEALEVAQDNLRPHGDNCFLHDEGEYNRCFCGKDSLSDYLQDAVEKLDTAIKQARSAPVQDSTCNETLRAQGKAYPRTCRKCGKGPCIGAPKQPPAQPAVQEPDLIARLKHPEDHYECTDPKKANAVLMSLCQEAADALAAPVQEPVAVELVGVEDAIKEGDGFWKSCTGCYETNEGHPPTGAFFSPVFKCHMGHGCGECGGIGAIWDDTDYEATADHMMRDDSTPPALAAPVQEPVAFEVGLVEWVGNKLMATPKVTTTPPASWVEMVTANLVREGVNKHKARELAEHFYSLAQRQWVGLTDDDVSDLCGEASNFGTSSWIRHIEAKLRSKNNG